MQIISDYRALHRIPEQDRNLPRTLHYLRGSLGQRAFSPMPGALAAFFDFGADHAIGFRSDMDALPGGHLCGHDGHMAILLELARRLEKTGSLPHNVLLLFQPAEETTGGARDLCATGVLEKYRVEALFGLHIWPGLSAGKVFTRPGPLMARSCQIDGQFSGEARHIAAPGPDAVAAAAEFVTALRWESREGLLKFGLFQAGTAGNATAPIARVSGSLRCFSEQIFTQKRADVEAAAEAAAKKYRCCCALDLSVGYPPVINPPTLLDRTRQAAPFQLLEAPVWMAEDFSYYQRQVPALFFFLGAGDVPPLHSEGFHFPEEILPKGADFWETLAKGI